MQCKRKKPLIHGLNGLFCILFLLLFQVVTAFSQIKSTLQVKRVDNLQIKREVITTAPIPEKKDTPQVYQNVKKQDINRKISVNDVIVNKPILTIVAPDSIQMGDYTIVVEAYDRGGEWNEKTLIHNHLNGTGRIKFSCPVTYTIIPGLWKDAVMKPVYYKVVDKVITTESEISTADATVLGIVYDVLVVGT